MHTDELAEMYYKIHNDASAEFREAFASIGARMWPRDDAHPLKPANLVFVKERMAISRESMDFYIKTGPLNRPLTLLDSYPQLRSKRPELEAKVDEIFNRYNRLWNEYLISAGWLKP